MSLQVAGHQINSYTIATPVYEGPLDLLLDLIEKAELDITKLALAQVTDQYLEHLQNIQDRDPGEVSAFLVIAAKLLQIKSAALLPRPPQREIGEEDPGDLLARQLIIYKRFKEIANWLSERDQAGLHSYVRISPPPKPQAKLLLMDGDLNALYDAIKAIFDNPSEGIYLEEVVAAPRITIREKISYVLQALHKNELVKFRSLFDDNYTRLEVVVTFLALLELIKRNIVEAQQEALFSDFVIQPISELQDIEGIELEFGE
jgi:segregation and condensation protein A